MASFSRRVLAWYRRHGRTDLPWQHQRSRYRVWVSETMLQQTQVNTVVPYFEDFVRRFPDLLSLAEAPLDEVLHHWSGLGYYARGRNLHAAARSMLEQHGGKFPSDYKQILALPGVGRSTAGAILALADGRRQPILDGNVKRVLARFHAIQGWPGRSAVLNRLWELAEGHTPQQNIADYTQAIMDLGATVCTRTKPACERCPLRSDCRAFLSGRCTEFPTPRPKRRLPLKSARFVIVRNRQGHVLLQQRPPSGVWGGLWGFPECPLERELGEWCEDTLGYRLIEAEPWEPIRHTFSHFHLDITPIEIESTPVTHKVMEPAGNLWYNMADPPAIGLAAPVKTLISRLTKQ